MLLYLVMPSTWNVWRCVYD